jgi:uncharacterized protein YndB with AHSA1/START domain
MTDRSTEPPRAVVRTVDVAAPPARAFHLFTAHIGDWWPLRTHSVHGDDAVDVTIDGRVGGQVVERARDGATSTWGTVVTWAPGREVAFHWHPGNPPDEATRVRVTFEPSGAGTRVVLIHDGWQARPDADDAREQYDAGWRPVLAAFTVTVATSSSLVS